MIKKYLQFKHFRLAVRKLLGVSIDPVPVEDIETEAYDYENDHDTSEYCPNLALVSIDAIIIKGWVNPCHR